MQGQVIPVVHLNGTSKEMLLRPVVAIVAGLNTVLNDLRDMAPNGRDYYPVPGLMDKARDQYLDWDKRVRALLEEMQNYEEGIDQQGR